MTTAAALLVVAAVLTVIAAMCLLEAKRMERRMVARSEHVRAGQWVIEPVGSNSEGSERQVEREASA